MNCIRCNEPLPPDARFCRNCGAPVSINNPSNSNTPDIASTQPDLPMSAYNTPTFSTIPVQEPPSPRMEQIPQTHQAWVAAQQTPQQKWILPEPQILQASAQQPYYQPAIPAAPGTMQSTGQKSRAFASAQYAPVKDLPPRRRRRGRRLRITLITLIVLILVFAAAWVFAARPYLHSLAQNQIDSALSSTVNQINLSQLPLPPSGVPVPPLLIREDAVNNLYLPLVQAPSSPVQNMRILITSNEIQLDFTVYGFASDITGRPTLVNGKLVATNVNVGGVAGLVMSSDEMTALLNKHLADVQAQLHRPISQLLLLDHELEIILG